MAACRPVFFGNNSIAAREPCHCPGAAGAATFLAWKEIMKYQSVLKWLIPPTFALALLAAGRGLFDRTPGQPYALTSFRGEPVTLNARELYDWETRSRAVQQPGNIQGQVTAKLIHHPLK